MKKTFYFLIIALFISQNLDAQCWNDINTTSTDWRISTPINRFNWTAETYDSFYITKFAVGTTVAPASLVLYSIAQEKRIKTQEEYILCQEKRLKKIETKLQILLNK